MKRFAFALLALIAAVAFAAPSAGAGPLDEAPLPGCTVSAEASDGYGVYLFLNKWYWGLGTAEISCTATVPANAVTVSVTLTPAGGDANSAACQSRSSCYTEAEARGPDAPAGNCTWVGAEGIAVGAVAMPPADAASACSTPI